MLSIRQLLFAIVYVAHVRGINIMLNKPSVQSSTYNDKYHSNNANDENRTGDPSLTGRQDDPYWQGDLQGFYAVTSIIVTSAVSTLAYSQRKAIIGVSVHDVGYSGSELTICGQWPDETLQGHTIVFNCSHTGPVRFVRIVREVTSHFLSLGEVEVEGEPSILDGAKCDKVMLQKVATPSTSLSVASVTDCSRTCLTTQPCLAFSYSSTEQPNCLLATDVSMTSDVMWISCNVSTSSKMATCN